MESRDVILRPVITEASMADMDDKRYTFDVDTRATKTQVKVAVEDIFEVEVANVNIMNVKGKKKHMGRYEGYTRKRRKAIVNLKTESKYLQFFNEELNFKAKKRRKAIVTLTSDSNEIKLFNEE